MPPSLIHARLGNAALELTSGYGYAPTRAAAALALWFLLGWAGVEIADHQGAFEASRFMDANLVAAPMAAAPGSCPWLEPPLYALDVMLPVVDFGHESLCAVREGRTFWHNVEAVYRLIAWLLVSIAFLTFSGILRKGV